MYFFKHFILEEKALAQTFYIRGKGSCYDLFLHTFYIRGKKIETVIKEN